MADFHSSSAFHTKKYKHTHCRTGLDFFSPCFLFLSLQVQLHGLVLLLHYAQLFLHSTLVLFLNCCMKAQLAERRELCSTHERSAKLCTSAKYVVIQRVNLLCAMQLSSKRTDTNQNHSFEMKFSMHDDMCANMMKARRTWMHSRV